MQEISGQVKELGGSIIAVSPQLTKYSKQVVKKHKLTFPVLADEGNKVADKLGITFKLPEKLRELYNRSYGIDLQRFNGNDSWELPMSGRFVVDTRGIVRSIEVHPDHHTRPEPIEIVDFMKKMIRSAD